ncbi:DegT/DnrJ/EryC1/StrS family aminotransferase [Campylobacter fetus]|uniref:Aminotransferase DegT n=1 Tax=Campylobacter fetus subsp. testudinum TaxID=1507806 RepID=A0AAX0HDM4_CAMFE|nr:DegT/DnrJ/EryC1/StrS aminotransferase family protein [Campylobacter fetus]AGZ81917.1 aminotransferase, DegT/DnrJ/EryC1/StrS family [Campylobacter fetus subsp. testudinum 03-427]AJB45654.1 aminotransferase DegT [Campylobacter fetus subsp. testudinum]ALV65084.1 aminotransferase, DegT/DnrJ/EryC1/StrS family [Campylobacter fetus subsp. testudinum Sp3]AVK81358.1 DegT/DnrJ/EryC1/StrS aminotransferase family protein [Campylobacter fetus subsp. testudinum]EAI4321787.1 DegT/DnrJ/EryC1/StrS aminotran
MRDIAFFRPYITEREHELVKESLDKNAVYMVTNLEDKIKKYFGVKHVITTNNGTAANHLALCAMDLKRGDKIICSVNAFPSIAQVIRHFDAEPIFVDIDEDDFNISPVELEKVLKEQKHKKLKAAFVTHVAGQSADMDTIYALAKENGIKIIDDASRAMGATYKGKLIGNLDSYMSCFQINPQVQHAIASTGIILTNDDEMAKRARLIRNHAIVNDSFDKDGNLGYVYDVVDIGQKYDLNSLCAAFSIAQFEKLEMFIRRRKEIAAIYNEELKACPHITTPVIKRDHVYNQYIIKVDKNRDGFARELKDAGIHTGLHYIPLHLLSYYKTKYNLRVNDFPKALKVYQQVLSLPIYAAMSNDEVKYVCDTIKSVAKTRV